LSHAKAISNICLEGVKVLVAWGQGEGTASAANGGFADQEEVDFRFAYEPERGATALEFMAS
jgi:hypothetical protein